MMTMMTALAASAAVAASPVAPLTASAAVVHCQIPCGIYDDSRVFDELEEHVATIARSLDGIEQADGNAHDIARWAMNKENHAQKIQDIASEYFLAQRVAVLAPGVEGYTDYVASTVMLHQIIVAAMKTKQSTDRAAVDTLKARVAMYRAHYSKIHGHDI